MGIRMAVEAVATATTPNVPQDEEMLGGIHTPSDQKQPPLSSDINGLAMAHSIGGFDLRSNPIEA